MAFWKPRYSAASEAFGRTGSFKAASGAFVFPSSMTFSGKGSWLSIAPTRFPYGNTDPLQNSAAINLLAWITRNFPQAEFKVCKQVKTKGKIEKQPLENHPLQQLLERPNLHYGGATMWAGLLLSYHLDGNAYLIKVRNARGLGYPTELWYEPHWSIKPHWPSDGSKFIDYYERTVNGRTEKIPPENVVHLRNGLNPANSRYGLAPLRGALLQVYSDIEVDTWISALCRNMAIPGVVVSPEANIGMTAEKAESIKQTWKRKFGGDNKGEPLILDFKATVEALGFDPKNMEFKAVHDHAESRIAGALGVPPALAFLNVANASSTYNNLQTMERLGWEQCLVPSYESIEDQLDTQLLPDFELDALERGIYTEFDTSNVRALKEDQGEKEKRAAEAFKNAGRTWNEYRAELGLAPDPDGDWLLLPNNSRPVTIEIVSQRAQQEIEDQVTSAPNQTAPSGESSPSSDGKRLPVFSRKVYEYDGVTLGREPSELEKQIDLKAISLALDAGKQSVGSQLGNIRERLIDELAVELDALDTDEFNQAETESNPTDQAAMVAALAYLFMRGASLVFNELKRLGFDVESMRARADEKVLAEIGKAILAKLSNDVRARAIASAVEARLFNVSVAQWVRTDLRNGSTAYVDRAASEAANVAISKGRKAELGAQGIEQVLYSAVLDNNLCENCSAVDGLVGSPSEVPDVPNAKCLGGCQCRCLLISVKGL